MGIAPRPSTCLRIAFEVVTLVRVQDLARRKPRQKFRARSAIGDLAACECERERTAFCVRQRMDFGRPSAARATDRLVFLPPFPPEAERWAFTAELSIKTCSGGPPACASAWNKPTQTPFAAQRT